MRRKADASKIFFVATKILVFDFELLIGGRCEKSGVTSEGKRSRQLHSLPAR